MKSAFFFAMGVVGSSTLDFLKGVNDSPRGMRLVGGSQAVRMNTPRSAGSMALFGGLYSVFECSMAYIRQKEDPWNPIIGNAAVCGFHWRKEGFRAVTRATAVGAAVAAAGQQVIIMRDKNRSLQKKETSSSTGSTGSFEARKGCGDQKGDNNPRSMDTSKIKQLGFTNFKKDYSGDVHIKSFQERGFLERV
ncbi:hypothetical protein H6P81_008738 [Aristolochia fimbriata]|uniref:Mitochondrial import inner membrane translocase subunit Tim17/Tim22/Tim23 family protein n=1 Tax=Aristolochia fimbriata TaxID=158543 RepID=A0AAV7ENG0_ARIFI|nr:hypothetical protein H6P81_008738 [Aristolochia fimbriata]